MVSPEFPATPGQDAEWSVAARAVALPRRWLVVGRRDGAEVLRVWTAEVADRLDVSPAPDLDGPGVDDDVELQDTARWMVDFDTAERSGMAVRIPAAEVAGGLARRRRPAPRARRRLGPHPCRRRREHPAPPRRTTPTPTGCRRSPRARRPTSPSAGRPGRAPTDARLVAALDPERRPSADAVAGTAADRLYRALGLPLATDDLLRAVPGADGRSQATEIRLADALWESTLGSFLSDVLRPVVPDSQNRRLRDHVREHLFPGGPFPAVRVSRQPYGVLPVVAAGFEPDPTEPVEAGLLDVLAQAADLLGAGDPERPPPRAHRRPRRRPRRPAPDHAAHGGRPVPHRPRAAHRELDRGPGPARRGAAVHQQHARGPSRRPAADAVERVRPPSRPPAAGPPPRRRPHAGPARRGRRAGPDERQLRPAQGPGGRGRHPPGGDGALRRRTRAASRGSGHHQRFPGHVGPARRGAGARRAALGRVRRDRGGRPGARGQRPSRHGRGGVTGGDPRRHRVADGTRVRHRPSGRRHRRRPGHPSPGARRARRPELPAARRARPSAARAARRLQPPARRLVHLAGDPSAGRPPVHHARRGAPGRVRLARRPASRDRRRRQPRLRARPVVAAGGHRRRAAQRTPGAPRRGAPGARDRPHGRAGADRAHPPRRGRAGPAARRPARLPVRACCAGPRREPRAVHPADPPTGAAAAGRRRPRSTDHLRPRRRPRRRRRCRAPRALA